MLSGIGSTIAQGVSRKINVAFDIWNHISGICLFFSVLNVYYFFLIAGMAFGTGSAVAHRAVDAVMGPRTIQHETVVSEAAAAAPAPTSNSFGGDACNVHSKAFQDVCY